MKIELEVRERDAGAGGLPASAEGERRAMDAAEPEGARGLGRGGGEVLNGMEMTSSSEGSEVVFDLGMGMLDVRDGLPAMVGDENKVRDGEFEGERSDSKCAQTSAVSRARGRLWRGYARLGYCSS